jgi:hypothetical protein
MMNIQVGMSSDSCCQRPDAKGYAVIEHEEAMLNFDNVIREWFRHTRRNREYNESVEEQVALFFLPPTIDEIVIHELIHLCGVRSEKRTQLATMKMMGEN